ncbi:hypothetical protein GCM10009434_24610 [Brevundimonas olei]
MVPRLQVDYGGSDLLHDARAFVSKDGRQWRGDMLLPHMGVRCTNAGRNHADKNLVGARVVDDYLAEGEGRVLFSDDCGSGQDAHAALAGMMSKVGKARSS